MGGKTDIATGRIKEAAGALTDNDQLRAQGKADQAAGKVAVATRKIVDKVKKVARQAVDKAKRTKCLLLVAAMLAAISLPGHILLAQGKGGGGPGGGARGNGGGEGSGNAGGGAGRAGGGGRGNIGGGAPGASGRVNAGGAAGGRVSEGGPRSGGGNFGGRATGGVGAGGKVDSGAPANGAGGARIQGGGKGNPQVHIGGGANGNVGVVRNGGGRMNQLNQPGTINPTKAAPSFTRGNVNNQPSINPNMTGRNRAEGGAMRNPRVNNNNAILQNGQLSGQHWNGNWNNNHNNGYWNNRSFFFGGSSPFGYGNGSYAYRNNPYSYGFGGLGYGLGIGLGGIGLGGYGLGGNGGYGNGYYSGYGGYPSYGYYNNGANAYAVNQVGANGDAGAVALAPDSGQPSEDSLDFAGHGELDFKAGNYEGAVRNWKHALVEDPNNGALVLLLAQGLFALGTFDQAAGATQTAMQMLPPEKWGAVIENYKELYGNAGDYTNQLKALENARDGKPADSAVRFLLGFHFGYLGYPKEAVRELDKTLQMNAKDAGARRVRDFFAAKIGIAPSTPLASPTPAQPSAANSVEPGPQTLPSIPTGSQQTLPEGGVEVNPIGDPLPGTQR